MLDELDTGYAKYIDLYDSAPMGYFILDRDAAILKVNLAGASLLGLERQGIVKRNFQSFITEESLSAFNTFLNRVFVSKGKHMCEISLMKGEESFTLRLEAVEADSGRDCLAIAYDITEHKRMQNLIRLRIYLMEYALDHSLEELLCETLDNAGVLLNSPIGFYHFIDSNEKFILLQAWSTRTQNEFCNATGKGLHYSIEDAGVWADCIHQRKPIIHNDYVNLPHKKGMPEGHAKVIREMVVPVMRDGKIVAILGVGNKPTDYTEKDVEIISFIADVVWTTVEHKRTEEALYRSEAHFKLLSETAEELIMWKNVQPIINELCKKTMAHLGCHVFLNYLVDEKSGYLHLNAFEGISDKDAAKIEWLYSGVTSVSDCADQKGATVLAENICPISDPRVELIKSYGIQAHFCHPLTVQGNILGTLSFGTRTRTSFSEEELVLLKRLTAQLAGALERSKLINEIQLAKDELESRVQERTAELKKMNEALRYSNMALEDFAHIASHDLQEPLRKIMTFSERLLVSKQDSLDSQARDYMAIMKAAAARMQALIKDLVKYSRVTSSQGHFKVFNLRGLVEDSVSDLTVLLEENEGRVKIDELPDVKANNIQIRQLFQNLISNALKYRSNQRPVIRIYTNPSSEDGFNEIHVGDNGIGFDEMHIDKIFKPFQRLHGKSSPYQGTGMGLAICRKIVESHGGSITAKSEPGKGSTFIVKLPKAN
jgi:PAS domain S-box-containing protein